MVKVYQVDAFTSVEEGTGRQIGGNPAGVVVDANGLSDDVMQSIAAQVGFSETAFVMRSDHAGQHVRFFTPTQEVGLCGHATIATYHLLGEQGVISNGRYVMQARARDVTMVYDSGLLRMVQDLVEEPFVFGKIVTPQEIASCFGLEVMDIDFSLSAQVISTGAANKVFAAVKTLEQLQGITPDLNRITQVAHNYGAKGIYLYTLETVDPTATAHARNYSPELGIVDEAATGTSAAALSCLLWRLGKIERARTLDLRYEQGYTINRPSLIRVSLEVNGRDITRVVIAGYGTTVRQYEVEA
jgi:PhzF family phenazine biosynthesis protein